MVELIKPITVSLCHTTMNNYRIGLDPQHDITMVCPYDNYQT